MSNKHKILVGTFVLTATGFLTRFIGFFFRMFLSHAFGEEQVGLYQLIFPIYALCFSFSCAGIETAISRTTARKISIGKKDESVQLLYVGIIVSLFLSFFSMILLQNYALDFSVHILGDVRCTSMLTAISYALPFASVHSCIVGFYLGLKQTKIPAISQLLEQLIRIMTVYIIYLFCQKHNYEVSILFAVVGIVFGEICSSFFCVYYFTSHIKRFKISHYIPNLFTHTKELLQLSTPITGSRILLNILQSVESISIPLRLQIYGYSSSMALSNYGVLMGMALPCILFPSAITNSVSTMLLPTVAEIQAGNNYQRLKDLIQKIFFYCFLLGTFCFLLFFIFSSFIGIFLFHSTLVADYLKTLSWICPFLYLNTTLISVVNGLGKANISFIINMFALSIRILCVLFMIPKIGMQGYLWGLLSSQFFTFLLCVLFLLSYLKKKESFH